MDKSKLYYRCAYCKEEFRESIDYVEHRKVCAQRHRMNEEIPSRNYINMPVRDITKHFNK